MSPEIEWQISDEAGRGTIAKTPPPRSPSHGRKILVALMVVLGIGLGMVYWSIPEPPPATPGVTPSQAPSLMSKPTSTPSTLPIRVNTPPAVQATRLSARALATLIFGPIPPPLPVTPIAALKGEGLLLFVCTEARALCLMYADGTDLRQITVEGQYFWPRWSPDGRVFTALRLPEGPRGGIGDGGEVVLFSAEGNRLTAFSFGDTDLLGWANPIWSPDGRWLALTLAHDDNGDALADPGEPFATWILDRTTLQPAFAPIQGSAFDWPPSWSVDSRWLAFVQVTPSGTLDQNETREVRVFDTQHHQPHMMGRGNDPAWLPHSDRLTFINADRTELQIVDVVTSKQQTLLTDKDLRAFLQRDDPWLPEGELSFAWPVWSPDGSTLAFRVWGQSDEPRPKYIPGMLFTVNAGGESLRRWPDTDVPNTALQVWSPTSDRLAYTYWMVGDGRYDPNSGTPTPQRRFTYKDCCSGLILVDLRQGSYWDEPGPHSIDLQPVGAWSPDGRWFAAVNASRLMVISVEYPERHWTFPNVGQFDEVQWQPKVGGEPCVQTLNGK